MSPKTVNEHQNALNALLNWMTRQGRIEANPLKDMPKIDVRGKQQMRRAYTDDELRRLLAVAGDHRLIYLTAAYTGLRLGELGQLVWGDLQLEHERPHIRARASTTKNRRDAVLPLHPMLLAELKAAKAKAKPKDNSVRVFKHTHTPLSPATCAPTSKPQASPGSTLWGAESISTPCAIPLPPSWPPAASRSA